MSMYNSIMLEIQLTKPLTRDDMCDMHLAINKAFTSIDNVDDINTKLEIKARFNYNLETINKIMTILEKYCMYEKPTQIGAVDIESRSIKFAHIYAYKDIIFIMIKESECIFNIENIYLKLLDFHDRRLDKCITIREEVKDYDTFVEEQLQLAIDYFYNDIKKSQ